MHGNERKDEVWKPCAKCQERKKKCPHEGEWVDKVSQETACAECRRLKIKCTHKTNAGSSTPAAGGGMAKRAEAVRKPARVSYAEAVRAAQRGPAASPERGLTAPEHEAAEAFLAPDPVGAVQYEVMYFDEKDVPGYNPDLR